MSYASKASSGMLWLAMGTVVAKVSSFLSLIVLGWYLSKEEFALYALAFSSAAFFMAIRNGGVHQILMQRGAAGFERAANLYARYALSVNLLAMAMIVFLSPLVAKIYNTNDIYLMQFIIAVSLPLGTAGLFYHSKLAVDLRFADVARFDAYSSIARHGSATLFAILGFGVYSFLLPLIVVALFETLYGKYKTEIVLFKKRKLTPFFIKRILNSSRWLILSSVAISIILQGDYLVIGFFESRETLGLYFFGFQLTIAIAVVISQGMQSVVMPLMSSMKNDTARQADAFTKMLVVLVFFMTFISFQMCLVSGYFIHHIWGGKWDDAIIVVQLMSISLATNILGPLGKSVLEARGRWQRVSYLMVIDAIGIVLSAYIGSQLGGLIAIAISVSVYRFIYGLIYILYVAFDLKLKVLPVTCIILAPVIAGVIPLLTLFYIFGADPTLTSWFNVVINITVFSFMYFVFMYVVQPRSSRMAWEFLQKNILNRIRFRRY